MLGAVSSVYIPDRMPKLTVTVDFVHILWRYSDDAALLDYFGILPHNGLDDL
jgi:hypothetical protein